MKQKLRDKRENPFSPLHSNPPCSRVVVIVLCSDVTLSAPPPLPSSLPPYNYLKFQSNDLRFDLNFFLFPFLIWILLSILTQYTEKRSHFVPVLWKAEPSVIIQERKFFLLFWVLTSKWAHVAALPGRTLANSELVASTPSRSAVCSPWHWNNTWWRCT